MSSRFLKPAGLLAVALLALALALPAQWAGAQTPPQRREPPPGEGVICAWAIYSAMAEVGRRCVPDENPAFQEELARSIASIDAYVVANSTPTPTAEQIAAFKRQQGGADSPTEMLCTAEMIGWYRSFSEQGAETLRTSTEQMLARPGPPSWGTCL